MNNQQPWYGYVSNDSMYAIQYYHISSYDYEIIFYVGPVDKAVAMNRNKTAVA